MIFVAVGLHYQGFDRLIKAMDEIAPELDEEVVAQTGSSSYAPVNMTFFQRASVPEVEEYFSSARLVVSHAGAGSILTALNYSKPLVVVPRLEKYREHINDHQLELASAVEGRGIIVVHDMKDLRQAIANAKPPKIIDTKGPLVSFLRDYLRGLDDGRG